VEIRVRVVHCP
jgi:hypothetical protein